MTSTSDETRDEDTRQDLSRRLRRQGVLIAALFGLLWAAVAASGLPAAAASAVGAIVAALAASAVAVVFRPGPATAPERERRQPDGWYRRVGVVNVAQFAVIALTVAVGIGTGSPELVPPVVCLIVGVHFLPLARLFDQPQYTWTGVALCLVAGAGLLVLLSGPAPSRVVVGVGAAATLLGTAWHLALRPS